ncbi:MAG: hypothetical protein A3F25_01150 [Candidatus Yanofskybacteria bacterium RIFCSPHIGHO2_12_FULL_45_19b]|uniref:Uncharacterized protein n=1 Tax=Candidatus Yanofskybacteria bacterium RIFCSPHIGHO2_12_FULL_45_19b TaxID=1802689 RepID=A0A1F8G2A1_9BACT|nr:MAG: hypothetical protein A3F25_01150 [Candidatus Yanofskybacteria bacterium RIFCSPHIGHO2_12_FULL_45_19b]
MVRVLDRQEAVRLRKLGKSFTYIRKKLNVAKGTLSYWISGIKLTKEQLKNIQKEGRALQVERYIKTRKEQRKKIFDTFCEIERANLLPLTKRDFLVAGLFLYLGEGSKSTWWETGISNSNPAIIRFVIFWLTKILKVPKNKIKIYLHLYKNMDIKKELGFWSETTKIPLTQFRKPYVKKTSSLAIDYFTFGHGTCNVLVNGGDIKNKIMAGIRVILEEAKSRIDNSTPSSPRFI